MAVAMQPSHHLTVSCYKFPKILFWHSYALVGCFFDVAEVLVDLTNLRRERNEMKYFRDIIYSYSWREWYFLCVWKRKLKNETIYGTFLRCFLHEEWLCDEVYWIFSALIKLNLFFKIIKNCVIRCELIHAGIHVMTIKSVNVASKSLNFILNKITLSISIIFHELWSFENLFLLSNKISNYNEG